MQIVYLAACELVEVLFVAVAVAIAIAVAIVIAIAVATSAILLSLFSTSEV